MCGICGIIHSDNKLIQEATIHGMMYVLKRPDLVEKERESEDIWQTLIEA